MSVAAPPSRALERDRVAMPAGVETRPERDSLPDSELGGDSMLVISTVGVLAVTTVVAFIAAGPEWMAGLGIATALVGVTALMLTFVRLVGESDEDGPGR
jgi:hypothetical protein